GQQVRSDPVTQTAPPPIAGLLAAVRDLLGQRESWLQVKLARATQDALLTDLSAVRQKAERRLADARMRSRPAAPAPAALTRPRPAAPAPAPLPPPEDWSPPATSSPLPVQALRPAAPPEPRRPSLTRNRAQLSEWANRFQRFLAVGAEDLMRINQIVEDGDRP